jgi:hypothetical protein
MRDIYANAGPGCKAHDQAAYEQDMQINKITPDPVLPSLGGTPAWPSTRWGVTAVGAVIANPLNSVPGHESQADRVHPAPGNTYRKTVTFRR